MSKRGFDGRPRLRRTDYGHLAESYGTVGRTGRITRESKIVTTGVERKIDVFKRFRQSGGELKSRLWTRTVQRHDGPNRIVPLPYGSARDTWETDVFRDREDTSTGTSRKAQTCRCIARKGESLRVNRNCPIHAHQVTFVRLLCPVTGCNTSFVRKRRFQDCCEECWRVGETPNARNFGPSYMEGRD